MFSLQNPLRILLVTVVVIFVTTAGNAQQCIPTLPDFMFSNDSYGVACTDKKEGGCEQLIEHLKSLQKPKESVPTKPWNENIRSASL